MNDKLVFNWNSIVKPEDTVYHMGDFSMRTPKEHAEQLNGKKILIIGNHDRESQCKGHFDEIHERLEIEIDGRKVNLSHYPYWENVGPYDHQFMFKMMKDDGKWLIHGHVHNSAPALVKKSINACVEHWDYKPISEDTVIEIMRKMENGIDK